MKRGSEDSKDERNPEKAKSVLGWWEGRRLRYNVGLVAAGMGAFAAYVAVGAMLLPPEAEFELNPLFTMVHAACYMLMIGAANVCYYLGPLSEWLIRPAAPGQYRRVCYGLGFWGSVLLPFSIPVLLAVTAIFNPGYWAAH